jgi:hypothetical protein
MKFYLLCAIVIICTQNLQAQEFAFQPSLRDQLLYGPLDTSPDSLSQPPKRKLIPTNASYMEKFLWDEDGLFRNMGLASPLTPEVRKSELSLRRNMLTAHLIGGFVTLGSMITACYYGQKMIDDGGKLRSNRSNHQLFVTVTIASYSATGLLAVLSPPPMIRRDEISTTTIHKTLAWVHFLGMVVTPIIGASLHRNATTSQIAHFHQASAYITTAALAASLIVITF